MNRRHRKKARARLIEAREESDWARFRAAVPFGHTEMEELLCHVSRLESASEPFGHTRQWLEQRGHPSEPVLEAFRSRGITSDFEVLMEANPYRLLGPTPRRLSWMPIERAQLEDLDSYLQGLECDGTNRHSAEWLTDSGLPVRETLTALLALGGGCDCEIAGVEAEWIYPPPLAIVPGPPPIRPPAAQTPRLTVYRDEAVVLPLPGKPWHQRTAPPGTKLLLQFGKGTQKPELRILAGPRPGDEAGWCRERWLQVHAEWWGESAGELPATVNHRMRERWSEEGRQVAGPFLIEHPSLQGSCYEARAPGHPTDARWWMLDLPGGFRVVELAVSYAYGTWEPFSRAAVSLLRTMSPA